MSDINVKYSSRFELINILMLINKVWASAYSRGFTGKEINL
jgi:hypothetical protein